MHQNPIFLGLGMGSEKRAISLSKEPVTNEAVTNIQPDRKDKN